jgi:serine/threonine protein kinase
MPFYYIDMELCQGNLEDFIKGNTPHRFDLSNIHRLLNVSERGVWGIWDIMEQITNGIVFIHACGEVHRDLKPRNGTSAHVE